MYNLVALPLNQVSSRRREILEYQRPRAAAIQLQGSNWISKCLILSFHSTDDVENVQVLSQSSPTSSRFCLLVLPNTRTDTFREKLRILSESREIPRTQTSTCERMRALSRIFCTFAEQSRENESGIYGSCAQTCSPLFSHLPESEREKMIEGERGESEQRSSALRIPSLVLSILSSYPETRALLAM